MFIAQYFSAAFLSLKRLLGFRKQSAWKIAFYFFILNLLAAYPLNREIIRQQGFDLSFIANQMEAQVPTWYPNELPFYCTIGPHGLRCLNDESRVYESPEFNLVLNQLPTAYSINKKTVLLGADYITYYDGKGFLARAPYSGFTKERTFVELQSYLPSETITYFAQGIEKSLSPYMIIFSLVTFTGITFLINTVFIFAFGLLLMIFKIGHHSFMTYKEAVKLTVLSMTAPVTVAFVVGLFGSEVLAFNTLIISFGVPLIIMLLIRGPGKEEFGRRL